MSTIDSCAEAFRKQLAAKEAGIRQANHAKDAAEKREAQAKRTNAEEVQRVNADLDQARRQARDASAGQRVAANRILKIESDAGRIVDPSLEIPFMSRAEAEKAICDEGNSRGMFIVRQANRNLGGYSIACADPESTDPIVHFDLIRKGTEAACCPPARFCAPHQVRSSSTLGKCSVAMVPNSGVFHSVDVDVIDAQLLRGPVVFALVGFQGGI